MVEGVFLQAAGFFSGGGFGTILSTWEQAGVFAYILPFLLIFAVVFGILMQVKLFNENRTVNAIIALAVGLMALQFDLVPIFFSELFPRFGVGLAVILVILILLGLFRDPDHKGTSIGLTVIVVAITAIVIYQTFDFLGYNSWTNFILANLWPIIGVVVLVGAFIAIIVGTRPSSRGNGQYKLLMDR